MTKQTERLKDMDTAREIAKQLLKIRAVFLRPGEPFTWASGIKSPPHNARGHRGSYTGDADGVCARQC